MQINKKTPIAKIENGTVYLNTDHGVLETSDVQFANKDELYLYEAISSLVAGTAEVIVTGYDGSMPGEDYVHGMMEGVLLYGKHGFQTVGKDISADSYFARLSEVDQQTALKLGQGLRELDTNRKVEMVKAAIERVKMQTDTEVQKNTAEDSGVEKRSFSSKFEQKAYDGFGITKPRDSVHVQKQVLKTLVEEGFFKDAEQRRTVVVNQDSGMEIEINRSGIEETFNYKNYGSRGKFVRVAKLETIRHIEEIIKKGKLVADNVLNKHNPEDSNKSFAYIDCEGMMEGIQVLFRIGIKRSQQKNKFWVHSVYVSKNTDGSGENSENGLTSPYIPVGADNSIAQNSEIVKGKVFYDERINLDDLTEKQRDEIAFAGTVIAAIGNTVHFYNSQYAPKDSREARTNGWYDPKDGSIHLDVAKIENGEESVLFTLSHELVHFIEDWSPAKYQTFANFLLKNYAEHDVPTDQLVHEKMAELKSTDYDYAMSELVADACERMLLDSNAAQKLAELNKTDKGLAQKIKDFFANVLKRIRNAYANYKGRTEAQYLQKMDDVLSEFHEMFAEALTDAARNYQDADGKLEGVGVKEKNQLKKSFANDVDLWLQGQYKKSYFDLGTTPAVFVKHGARNLPVIMTEEVLSKVTGGKHAISLDEIKRLPEQLNDPVLLFKGSRPASFVVLTELKDKSGIDIICAVHLERMQDRLKVNRIASLYGKGNIVDYVSRNISEGNLLDASKTKAPTWLSSRGLQLPKLVQDIVDANNSIPQKNGSVKTIIGENAKKDSKKEQQKQTSNRAILADLLESSIDTSTPEGIRQAGLLDGYRANIGEIEELEDRIRDASAEIKSIAFSTGKRDMERYNRLIEDRNRDQIRLNRLEREVLKLEALTPLKSLLDRQKADLQKRYEKKGREMTRNAVKTRVEQIKQRDAKKLPGIWFSRVVFFLFSFFILR
ncbi:MAG: hypothetical protein J6B86_06495 [Clostridia bacterium]|nr:hypothetical protein [Clostridia bacterium]